jgi:hypothetical protein
MCPMQMNMNVAGSAGSEIGKARSMNRFFATVNEHTNAAHAWHVENYEPSLAVGQLYLVSVLWTVTEFRRAERVS